MDSPDKTATYASRGPSSRLPRDRELFAAQLISQALFQEINADRLIERALRTALEAVNAEAGSILLSDPEAEQLLFRYVVGEKAELLRGMSFPWDKGLAGSVFMSGNVEIVHDVQSDTRHHADFDAFTGFRTKDMIVLPLRIWGKPPIGVLEVINRRSPYVDEEDVAMLTIISALATAAIERVRLFDEELIRRKAAEQALSRLNAELERRVQERTAELQRQNLALREEVAQRRRAEDALSQVREELETRVHDRTQELMKTLQENETLLRNLHQAKGHLEEKIRDLEGFQEAVIGREMKMIALEKELARLKDRKEEPR